MNATKRKFNALLNGIGNKSTTSLAAKEASNASHVDLTTTANIDSQAKKRRISGSSSILDAHMAKPTAVAKPSPTTTKRKDTSTTTTEAPKYAPWDREAFLKRLKSFSSLTDWTPKPARVNEVEWAKRGWVCQKFERVRCCLCNVEILVKLNKKEVDGKEEPVYVAQNIEDALIDKYVELIVTSHHEDCLWRKRGCDDSIFKLPLNHSPTTIHNLRQRYDEIRKRADNLPQMADLGLPKELDLDVVLGYLPSNFFISPAEPAFNDNGQPSDVNRVALSLALSGWQGYTHTRLGEQLGSLSCYACFRILGLWLFKRKEDKEASEDTAGAVVNCLDVLKEHRDYCPWRNPASQNGLQTPTKSGTPAIAGWEIVLRVLKNDYYLRHGSDSKATKADGIQTADAGSIFDDPIDDDEDTKNRDEKDKERWARLRRVKSLFDTKGGKKLQRADSKGKSAAQ